MRTASRLFSPTAEAGRVPMQGHGLVLVPVASSLHDPRSTARVLSTYRKWLDGACDCEVPCVSSEEQIEGSDLGDSSGLLALVLTGGTERILGALAGLGRPLLVLAHESMNSLPAALEAMSSIGGHGTRLLLGRGMKQLAEARAFVGAARTLARISRHRIGLIGGPSSWLTYSLPETEALDSRLGVKVVEISMEEFGRTYSSLSKTASVRANQGGRRGAVAKGVPRSDLAKSEVVYRALRALLDDQGLSSVSPRCFDFIKNHGATGCLALSRLNDEGVVAGCEGDVPSTVAMITLAEVAGQPAFMGNPSFIAGHRLVLAHCTVATRLAERVRYRTHFESGVGVALAGEFKRKSRVTVARFAKGYSLLRAGVGTVVKGAPWSEDLCRSQVEIRMDGDADVLWKRPIGNHMVLTYGDHVDALKRLASMAGIEFEQV